MEIQGRSLTFNGVTIKAKEGNNSDNLLKFSDKDSAVYVGNLKFPLARYNKFDPDGNGFLKVDGNYLILTYNYEQFTLNTVTFKTEKNEGEGQQATFTVQNGDQSFILTNAVEQEQTVKWTGQQITVTAINYATGAIDSQTVTPQPGQVYRLSATSDSHEEGELKTVGGELIEGGELKKFCVQEEYDIMNAPIAFQVSNNYSVVTAYTVGGYPGTTSSTLVGRPYIHSKTFGKEEEAYAYYPKMTLDVYAVEGDVNYPQGVIFYADNILKSQIYIRNPDGEEEVLPLNAPIVLQEIGDYVIYRKYDNKIFEVLSFSTSAENDIAHFTVETSTTPNEIKRVLKGVEIVGNTAGGTTLIDTYTLEVGLDIIINQHVTVRYPVQKVCVREDFTDTRYSYTTPVITTDTRRTVNTISLTISEIN